MSKPTTTSVACLLLHQRHASVVLPPVRSRLMHRVGAAKAARGVASRKSRCSFSPIFFCSAQTVRARFRPEVLEVTYKEKTIAEVLRLTVSEALHFFQETAAIPQALRPLVEVGLDYIRLGQPLNTLSGGESQRLKLASHMTLSGSAKRLLIFDEPTTGLHFEDIRKLLGALNGL